MSVCEKIEALKRDMNAVRLKPFIWLLSKEHRANSCQGKT